MRHNPLLPGGGSGRKGHEGLAQLRKFFGPNVVVLTRAVRPPIPGVEITEDTEKSPVESEDSNRATKGILRGMSEKSSLNLARLLSTLDWGKNGICVHVTLTYGREFPGISDGLASVKSQLVARFGTHCVCGIWRLEFQARLAPHFHLLCWVCRSELEEFSRWVASWWAKFSGNVSEHGCHLSQGDAGRARWYLAMHAAKRAQSPPFKVGRWWGYINRDALLGSVDVNEVGQPEERERVWWARLYRRATGCKVRQGQGLSWFLPLREQWRADVWIRDRIAAEREPRNPF